MAQPNPSRFDQGGNPAHSPADAYTDEPSAGGPSAPRKPSLSLGLIYFIIFRHKWKILGFSLGGIVAAIVAYKLAPPPYTSEAVVFIRYVQEKQSPTLDEESRVRSVDQRGETILRTEVEILSSFDLAQRVAREIGPQRILGPGSSPNDLDAAARAIRSNTTITAPRANSVITINFENQSRDLVQPLLTKMVETYLQRHAEIHRAVGVLDAALTQETDQLRARLMQTEEELRKIKERANVISVEDAKRSFSVQIARIQQDIMESEAELAERRASSGSVGQPSAVDSPPGTDQAAGPIPPEKAATYRQLLGQLDTLRRREQDMLVQFTPESRMVQGIRAQMAELESARTRLVEEYPAILSVTAPPPTIDRNATQPTAIDPQMEAARARAIESRIKTLKEQLARVHADAASLAGLETTISELERTKELQEQKYRNFAASLEQARTEQALGASSTNISVVQSPTPPMRDTQLIGKIMLGLIVLGLGSGLGISFAVELFLDNSVKRPSEIEDQLDLPLVLSIPRMRGRSQRALQNRANLLLPKGPSGAGAGDGKGQAKEATALVKHDANHELRAFFDALRDRLVYSFEMRGITRKPKLVAVTSCGADSGVSTVAAGLAASLSETGDGNVLLVDMNPDRKSPQFFHRGDLKVGLDDVLVQDTRDDAMVGENLYVVSNTSADDRLSWIMPKKFAALVPKMKASDFDYIIFDLPPVSQISATPQLARYMDQVLLVVEAEKTNREAVRKVGATLGNAGARVGVVLNKARSYVPAALDSEALGA